MTFTKLRFKHYGKAVLYGNLPRTGSTVMRLELEILHHKQLCDLKIKLK